MDEDEYQGVTSIQLSPEHHQAVIRAAAGDREVNSACEVFWDVASTGGYGIMCPTSPDVPYPFLVRLNAETPAEYLTGQKHLLIDPLMASKRITNKMLYEVQSHPYFLGLAPGARVSLSNLPYDNRCGGGYEFVRATTSTEDPGIVTAVHVAVNRGREMIEVVFTPRVCSENGEYGGVRIWATDGEGARTCGFGSISGPMITLFNNV